MMIKEILRMEHITLESNGERILENVNINLFEGEIIGILGLNGAGKTFLMNILCKGYKNYSGSIYFHERQVKSFKQLDQKGICYIDENTELVSNLDIAENIFLFHPSINLFSIVKRKKIVDKTEELLKLFDLNISPISMVFQLTVIEKHVIQICKAISLKAKIIVLDDITDLYSEKDLLLLNKIILKLCTLGISVIYVNHSINLITKTLERIFILRDGKCVDILYKGEYSKRQLSILLAGEDFTKQYNQSKTELGDEVFSVCKINNNKHLADINFSVRSGEILGIIDWNDDCRDELKKVLSGEDFLTSGEIYIKGKRANLKSFRDAIKNGIYLIPERGIEHGLYPKMSVTDNITFFNLSKIAHLGFLKKNELEYLSKELSQIFEGEIKNNEIKVTDLDDRIKFDLLISKYLFAKPNVIIWPRPTLGTDLITKEKVLKIIKEMSHKGIAVIILSSNFSDILKVCDKLIIVKNGMVKKELISKEIRMKNVIKELNFKNY